MTKGTDLITIERTRQIEGEGWSAGHDDEHVNGELVRAAACYAVAGRFDLRPGGLDEGVSGIQKIIVGLWPPTWELRWWKPKDRMSNLVRAGALIAAEIDRLLREDERMRADETTVSAATADDPASTS